jgi:hypothetical protein
MEDKEMNIGMLWFDNDPKTDLNGKIERAVDYYRSKYGTSPTLCFVHPSMLADPQSSPAKVELRTNNSVRPNHFWLGVNATGMDSASASAPGD